MGNLFCGSKRNGQQQNKKENSSSRFVNKLFPFKKEEIAKSTSTSRNNIEPLMPTNNQISQPNKSISLNQNTNNKSNDDTKTDNFEILNEKTKTAVSHHTNVSEPLNKFLPKVSKNILFYKKLDKKAATMRKISKRDSLHLNKRKLKYKIVKERRRLVSKENVSVSINKNNVTSQIKTQLPVGIRGFAADINRPNRFAFLYLNRNEEMPTELKKRSFEILFEQLGELNANIETLTHSYNNIVKSLMQLQVPSNKRNNLMSAVSLSVNDSIINSSEPIDEILNNIEISPFLNESTKRQAFLELNELVEELNVSLDEIHVYYDDVDGTFDFDEYIESEFRISTQDYQNSLKRVAKLKTIVQNILKIYNNQLINMFKLQ